MERKVKAAEASPARRTLAAPPTAPGRLPYITEDRLIGMKGSPLLGVLEPVVRTYLIGHGQQLARKRLAGRLQIPPTDADTRQTRRRAAFKAAKAAMKRRVDELRLAELDVIRGYRTVQV